MTKTTFFNLTLFDGTNDQNQANAWFTVDNDSGKLVDRGQGTPADADTSVDLNGQYVMPGFMNVHVHVTADPEEDAIETPDAPTAERWQEAYRRIGVVAGLIAESVGGYVLDLDGLLVDPADLA